VFPEIKNQIHTIRYAEFPQHFISVANRKSALPGQARRDAKLPFCVEQADS
jgi:hypothetical protein